MSEQQVVLSVEEAQQLATFLFGAVLDGTARLEQGHGLSPMPPEVLDQQVQGCVIAVMGLLTRLAALAPELADIERFTLERLEKENGYEGLFSDVPPDVTLHQMLQKYSTPQQG